MILRPSDDAVAIVTGGAYGAGRRIAQALAGRGYAVVIAYLRDQREAEGVVEAILAAGGAALAVRAEISDELDVERLFDETEAAFGGVDLVIHTEAPGVPVVNREAAGRLRPGGRILDGAVEASAFLESRR